MRLVEGNKNVIELLEGLLESAKSGELVAIVACTVWEPVKIGASWGYKTDTPHVWARLLAALSCAHQDFISMAGER